MNKFAKRGIVWVQGARGERGPEPSGAPASPAGPLPGGASAASG